MVVVAAGGMEDRDTNLGAGITFYGVSNGIVIEVDIAALVLVVPPVAKQSNNPPTMCNE